jgi:hypothetical protein
MWLMAWPARTDPVNATLRTLGWAPNRAPTSSPVPVTTLRTPSSRPAEVARHASSRVVAEVNSEGLATTVLPASNAGAMARAAWFSGAFHGVMTPTTPNGSRTV